MEAHFFVEGHSNFSYRTMPEYLYQMVLLYWEMQAYEQKINTPKP